jgi:hypothetical protein
MALLFKLPCIIWRTLNVYSGLDLTKIVSMTMDSQVGNPQTREETVKHIAVYIDRWLETHRRHNWNCMVRFRQRLSKLFCWLCTKREGTYLTGLYMSMKFVYACNIIAQFFFLNKFMAKEDGWFSMYGIEALYYLINNREMAESPRFPRITMCDFYIRQLNNLQLNTVQCVLPINLFNEKIFLFLWFWLVYLAILTCGSFLFWFWRISFRQNRARYVRKFLRIVNEINGSHDKRLCQKFADEYLRDDGIFVLRLVGKNSNAILQTDLIYDLWQIFKDKADIRKFINHNDSECQA